MNSKGFIFDLDGVIVDTARYHYLSWKKLARTLGFDITEKQNEQLKGISRKKSLQIVLDWGNIAYSDEEFTKLIKAKNNDYLAYIADMTSEEILPGVSALLDYLIAKNQPIALGSASKNAKTILKKTGIFHKFNAIVDGNGISKAKPDPEVFITAAKKMNIAPKNCIVFEDSVAGIEAARRAGMTAVGIGDKNTLNQADYVFKNMAQIGFDFIDKFVENESKLYHTR